jgi:hypothetical protein
MATYFELQTEVLGNLIDMPTFITTMVPIYINRALNKLQGKHDFQVMKTEQSITTLFETRLLATVPANFKALRGKMRYEDNLGQDHKITFANDRTEVRKYRSVTDTGFPQFVLKSEENDLGASNWEVYPLPDGNSDYTDGEYRIVIPYWRYLPDLSFPSDANWFTNQGPGAAWIVKEATAMGFFVNEDEKRALQWIGLAQADYKDLVGIDKRRQMQGVTTLVPHFGADEPTMSN